MLLRLLALASAAIHHGVWSERVGRTAAVLALKVAEPDGGGLPTGTFLCWLDPASLLNSDSKTFRLVAPSDQKECAADPPQASADTKVQAQPLVIRASDKCVWAVSAPEAGTGDAGAAAAAGVQRPRQKAATHPLRAPRAVVNVEAPIGDKLLAIARSDVPEVSILAIPRSPGILPPLSGLVFKSGRGAGAVLDGWYRVTRIFVDGWLAFFGVVGKSDLTVVTDDRGGTHKAWSAVWSSLTDQEKSYFLEVPVGSDHTGCSPISTQPRQHGLSEGGLGTQADAAPTGPYLVLLRLEEGQTRCSLDDRLRAASDAGASGVLMIGLAGARGLLEQKRTEGLHPDMVFTVVENSFGSTLLTHEAHTPPTERSLMAVSVRRYERRLVDMSVVVLLILSTTILAGAAMLSARDLRAARAYGRNGRGLQAAAVALATRMAGTLGGSAAVAQQDFVELQTSFPIALVVAGIVAVLLMYYLSRPFFYIVAFFFLLAGGVCTFRLSQQLLHSRVAALRQPASWAACAYADLYAALITAGIVVAWLFLHGTPRVWLYQDTLGACLLSCTQQVVRLPNMSLGASLLGAAWLSNMLWVVLSPWIFGRSVMLQVAAGRLLRQETPPLMMVVPVFGSDPFLDCRFLGFFDVLLPGLLISYFHRHDLLSGRSLRQGYFVFSVFAFAFGLLASEMLGNALLSRQPSLLYSIPAVLGSVLFHSGRRGDVSFLWRGEPSPPLVEAMEMKTTGDVEIMPWPEEDIQTDSSASSVSSSFDD